MYIYYIYIYIYIYIYVLMLIFFLTIAGYESSKGKFLEIFSDQL